MSEHKPPPEFERALQSICSRLRLSWRYWTAEPGDPRGDAIWSPFGPPLIRAIDHDRKLAVRMQYGKLPDSDPGGWVALSADRVTSGRWVVYEEIDGQRIKVYDICDADSGPVPLDARTLDACRKCYDTIEERMKELANRYEEGEVSGAVSPSGPPASSTVYRDAEQRAWRKNAEDRVREVVEHEWNVEHAGAMYRFNPEPEPDGVRHPAGFIISERAAARGGLLDAGVA